METATQDKLANAKASAKATFEHIKELVEALRADPENEDARQAVYEHPLSVMVRSDWYTLDVKHIDQAPAEYCILISTGGPAVRIIGDLDEYAEPKTATLQCQDWFTPWTSVHELGLHAEDVLLEYATCFYFGE